MGCTPALLYTLGLLPFGWTLQCFLHVLNIITAIVGTSTQPYFVSCTHQQVRCYICSYTPQVCEIAGKQY
jgi:hypothetical protein